LNITIPHETKIWAAFRFTFWDGPRAGWQAVRRHPKLWATFAVLAALGILFGRAAAYVVYLPPLLLPWVLIHRSSFQRFVVIPLRSDFRRWYRYQRHWPDVASQRRLSRVNNEALDVHPEIKSMRCKGFSRTWEWSWSWPPLEVTTICLDTLILRDLIGNDLQDYQEQAEGIARDYGARAGRAFKAPKGCVRLELAYGPDPLEDTIPALPIPASVKDIDFKAVPVGVTEQGKPWTIDLSLHVLLAGATGSGKSGVLQQLLRSLGPAIAEGLVVVHAVDPKDGMELGVVSEVCKYYEDDDPKAMADLLADAVTMMRKQSRGLKKTKLRKNKPTVERPLHLILIDEMIDLTDPKGPDKKIAESVRQSLGYLLRKGRASGFIVVGAVTDPRVDALPMRTGFPLRVAMRLNTPQETKMILGDGARLRGALPDEITEAEPGVGYVMLNGAREATRVRAAYVTDEDIEELVAFVTGSKPKLHAVK
jgi:S-DNA-T family DNA segregation ATPase FtsK/SpoIIIE